MALEHCSASAPGSLMLFGEHAVLTGSTAIVAAIDRSVIVTINSNASDKIILRSDVFPEVCFKVASLAITKPYTFVTAALKYFQADLTTGITVIITSEINPQEGLGSSAAVIIATIVALAKYLGRNYTAKEILAIGCRVQAMVTTGSGADLAASVFGGIIQYCPDTQQVVPLEQKNISLAVIYSGYKTTTPKVIAKVAAAKADNIKAYDAAIAEIKFCVKDAVDALNSGKKSKLAAVCKRQQKALESLGVADGILRQIVTNLRGLSQVIGAKISGAGLGDCVIAFVDSSVEYAVTTLAQRCSGVRQLMVQVQTQGFNYVS